MRIGYAVEGRTWGPRVHARAVATRTGAVVVGVGEPRPPLEGLAYRSVRWTDPHALDDLDLVLGDPSVVSRVDLEASEVSRSRSAGQDHAGVEDVWDSETWPIHPWAYEVLPTRQAAVAYLRSGRSSGDPLLVVLDQTTTPGVLERIVRDHARGWEIRSLVGWGEDRWIVGADLLVCSAGWAQTVQREQRESPLSSSSGTRPTNLSARTATSGISPAGSTGSSRRRRHSIRTAGRTSRITSPDSSTSPDSEDGGRNPGKRLDGREVRELP